MDTNTKTKMEITLTLTAKEAIWLKALVQNPQCHPDEESAENSGMRAAMFDALPSFEDLYRVNSHSASAQHCWVTLPKPTRTMNDTPTPRSDAAELTEPYEIRALGFCVVHIDDARQLERELAEANHIIKVALHELPVGYIPAHTPESIPERIRDIVEQLAEAMKQLQIYE